MRGPLPLRLLIAALALAGLTLLAGRELLPQRGLAELLGLGLALVVAVLVGLAAGAWCLGSLGQWLLRHGAEDTAWGWFTAAGRQRPTSHHRE